MHPRKFPFLGQPIISVSPRKASPLSLLEILLRRQSFLILESNNPFLFLTVSLIKYQFAYTFDVQA